MEHFATSRRRIARGRRAFERHLRSAALAVAVACAPAITVAQVTGTPVDAPKASLTPEKQAIVREHVARTKPPAEEVGPVALGATIPADAPLIALPEDTVTEVPKITSYKFVVAPNGIGVVDPETRQIVQIISR